LDDEESNVVTAGAIVTVNVHLTRSSMKSLIKGDSSALKSAANVSAIENSLEVDDDKENREIGQESEDQQVQVKKQPVWQKKKGGGKKGGGGGKKNQPQAKKNLQQVNNKNKPAKAIESGETETTTKQPKELKELPDVDDSDIEGSDDGTVSDSGSSSESHDKVREKK